MEQEKPHEPSWHRLPHDLVIEAIKALFLMDFVMDQLDTRAPDPPSTEYYKLNNKLTTLSNYKNREYALLSSEEMVLIMDSFVALDEMYTWFPIEGDTPFTTAYQSTGALWCQYYNEDDTPMEGVV